MSTVIVLAALAAVCTLIIRKMIKDEKSGKCTGGCTYCSMNKSCHHGYSGKKSAADKIMS